MGCDVTSAIYEAGYGSPSRVYEAAPTGKGMTPSAYRRHGAGMRIGYSIVPSAIGRVLVAATEHGVCSVKIGDSEASLVRDLRQEYSAAEISANAAPRRRVGESDRRSPSRRSVAARPADRRRGHRVPVEGVAGAAADSSRARRARMRRWRGASASRGRSARWPVPAPRTRLPRRPVPPRGAVGWRHRSNIGGARRARRRC